MDEGSALLSMDEQEEAFIDTSTSNGNSPGEGLCPSAYTCALPTTG